MLLLHTDGGGGGGQAPHDYHLHPGVQLEPYNNCSAESAKNGGPVKGDVSPPACASFRYYHDHHLYG